MDTGRYYPCVILYCDCDCKKKSCALHKTLYAGLLSFRSSPCSRFVSTKEQEHHLMEREVVGSPDWMSKMLLMLTQCAAWWQLLPRQLSPPVSALEVWDPPQPVPTVMSPLPRILDTKGQKRCQAQHGSKGLLIPLKYPPNSPTFFVMPPPFSPTVLHPSHHPMPFPSELNAICALRNTPPFVFPGSLIHSSSPSTDLQDAATGVLKFFHVRDPPNKPTLVHESPLWYDFIQGSHMGGSLLI